MDSKQMNGQQMDAMRDAVLAEAQQLCKEVCGAVAYLCRQTGREPVDVPAASRLVIELVADLVEGANGMDRLWRPYTAGVIDDGGLVQHLALVAYGRIPLRDASPQPDPKAN